MKFSWFLLTVSVLFSSVVIGVIGRGTRGDRSTNGYSTNRVGNDGLKEYFQSVLGLPKQTLGNNDGQLMAGDKGRKAVPLYVQNLYDLMAMETETTNAPERKSGPRQRRSLNDGNYNFGGGERQTNAIDEPSTIQAIERDHQVQSGDSGRGYLLKFNLEQLWISKNQLQLAELVLAVDYGRLTSPPGSYSIYAYAVDDDQEGPRTRLLVSAGSLGVLDTFRNNFVKLQVTDTVVQKVLAGGAETILFELFVSCTDEASVRRDLPQQEIEQIFHLVSRGARQPLLVLYSSVAASKIEEGNDMDYTVQSRRRRARSTLSRSCIHEGECCLHEWWIDLVELFRDTWPILMPEGYYANYCSGTCIHPMYDDRWNATGNAQIRAAYNGYWRHQTGRNIANRTTDTIPGATCVAQNPSPITIVYSVGERFIIRQLEGMAAHSCMCA